MKYHKAKNRRQPGCFTPEPLPTPPVASTMVPARPLEKLKHLQRYAANVQKLLRQISKTENASIKRVDAIGVLKLDPGVAQTTLQEMVEARLLTKQRVLTGVLYQLGPAAQQDFAP